MVLTNIYVDLLAFCVVLIVCCGFASVSRMTGGGGRTFLACLGLEILILLIHLVGWYWNLSGRERGLFSDLLGCGYAFAYYALCVSYSFFLIYTFLSFF